MIQYLIGIIITVIISNTIAIFLAVFLHQYVGQWYTIIAGIVVSPQLMMFTVAHLNKMHKPENKHPTIFINPK